MKRLFAVLVLCLSRDLTEFADWAARKVVHMLEDDCREGLHCWFFREDGTMFCPVCREERS